MSMSETLTARRRAAAGAMGLVGETPIVELRALSERLPHRILGKCEFLNPAGSVKDRIGQHIIRQAEAAGRIVPGRTTLVEATAGNTGAALAAAAAGRYRLVCTMSSKMGAEKEALLRAWGADVVRCPYDVAADDPESFLNTAARIAAELRHGYYVNQFNNEWNPQAHYLTTGPELVRQAGIGIAAFVAGVGTGGTFTGVGRWLRQSGSTCRLVVADPEGSVVGAALRGQPLAPRPYLIEGIGGDFVPALLDQSLPTEVVTVSDATSITTCLEVAGIEGLLLGGSSGCALAAAVDLARRLPGPRSDIVVLLADGGDRYLSTIYEPGWRAAQGIG